MEYLINKNWKIWNPNPNEELCYKVLLGKTSTGTGFQVTKYPTDNCQFASIGSSINILQSSDALSILKDMYIILENRPMFMYDLKNNQISLLKKLFSEKDIVLETPYVSTNGTDMTLFLIKNTIFM